MVLPRYAWQRLYEQRLVMWVEIDGDLIVIVRWFGTAIAAGAKRNHPFGQNRGG